MNLPPPLYFPAGATFSQRSRKGFSAMALVLVCSFVILLNRWPAGSLAAFRSAIRGDVILIDQHPSTEEIDHQHVIIVVSIQNLTHHPITLSGVQTSCDCIRPPKFPLIIAPRAKMALGFEVSLNPSETTKPIARQLRFYLENNNPIEFKLKVP